MQITNQQETAATLIAAAIQTFFGKRETNNGKRFLVSEYRLFAEGPGVTPDVATTVQPLHPFDRNNQADVLLEQQAGDLIASWADRSCRTS